MYYSKAINGFIPAEWLDDGTYAKLPADAVELTDSEVAKFYKAVTPAGKELGTVDGRLAWVDLPPLTPGEIIHAVDNEKQLRIDDANYFMNGKQWPGKAAIGRLKDDELAKYIAWLDYLDALEVLDTSSASEIVWPTQPAK